MRATTRSELGDAYRACGRLARRHYENFPVASLLLPARMRPHVAAVYAFARAADDFADEGDLQPEDRHRLLDDWTARLHDAVRDGQDHRGADGRHQMFVALAHTIRQHRLPIDLFDDLVSAFRQDITTHRYATWSDLLDYCRRSANPVGRLVLRIAGCEEAALDRASDAVCTALQLTNFWQDFAWDWLRGRLYLPEEEWAPEAARCRDLDAGVMTPGWQRALARAVARTRALFADGRAVCDGVGGRLAMELRITWLGGVRILDRLERSGFDVFRRRPTLGAADALPILWQAARWKSVRSSG